MSVLLILIGFAGVVVALVAVVRGRLGWARITSRKVAVLALVGAFAVFVTGTALAAPSTTGQQSAAGGSTTVLQTTSSTPETTAPETTTTVVTTVPVTTTTQVTTTHATTTRATVRRTTVAPPPRRTTVAPPPRIVRTTAARPVAPVSTLTCSASMTDAQPTHNETTDVVVHTGTADADVTATVHYKSKNTTKSGEAASSGTAEIPFDISTATVGFTVEVDVTVTAHGASRSCSTSFTPA
jgi:hypothetical protein